MLALSQLRLHAQAHCHQPTTDLLLATGQIHVVLGRNQSGKSALCRLLAGLPTNAQAEVSWHGQSWHGLSPRLRPVAMVYQAFINYPHWNVFANIASPLRAQGVAKGDIEHRVNQIAQRLGLEQLLQRMPAELSGGQQQRVAIGRALAQEAQLLILDEPLVNLDYKLREQLQRQLTEILRDEALTVVYTTSDPADALALGDQLILLDDHQVVQVGEPMAIYEHPQSFIAADLLSDPGINALPQSQQQRAIRPEHLSLEPIVDGLSFDLEVVGVETNGSHSFVHGHVTDAGAPILPLEVPTKEAAVKTTQEEPLWIVKLPGLVSLQAKQRAKVFARADDILEFGEPTHG